MRKRLSPFEDEVLPDLVRSTVAVADAVAGFHHAAQARIGREKFPAQRMPALREAVKSTTELKGV